MRNMIVAYISKLKFSSVIRTLLSFGTTWVSMCLSFSTINFIKLKYMMISDGNFMPQNLNIIAHYFKNNANSQ